MTNRILELHVLGQSIWYDNIQRKLLENGELAALIQKGELWGMTSNPSIFNQAIAKSTDYDATLLTLAWAGYQAPQILDRLIIEDIRNAADIFLPVYRETNGGDGYVSIEVGPEMANDTKASLAEAHRLWDLADHPNVMVKIPATEEGIPAIRQAIADGVNINITLIFSIARYLEVMDAYLSGLEQRLEKGQPIDRIASVASFFVSRIDTKVDKQLEEIIQQEGPQADQAAKLLGKIAIDNAKLAYAEFLKVFESERFARLKAHGARIQRPLWASTSTKNPKYPDTMYVDELIGPNTINTVPGVTLEAFRDHGTVRLTIQEGLDQAQRDFEELAKLGISIDQATKELEIEGVKAFAEAFNALTQTVEDRRKAAVEELGPLAGAVKQRVAQLEKESAISRMWEHDPTFWTKDPAGMEEARKRMGWLDAPQKSRDLLPDIHCLVDEVRAANYTHALLLGMGGSSLAPEVMRLIFGVAEGGLDLAILDSTDPAQVKAYADRSPADRTLYIVSSKSGGTAEVKAFFDYFWEKTQKAVGEQAADHFIAVTDPGTSLESLAHERKFRKVFLADPNVGGRYSALTAFGLAPAGLLGMDVERLLARADWMERQCKPDVPAGRNPGLVLGAVIGEAARAGRDKLTLITGNDLAPFGAWLEQLIAESSGKNGKGIIPIDGEPLAAADVYGADRLFVNLKSPGDAKMKTEDQSIARLRAAGQPVISLIVADSYDLGAEFYRWEVAAAIACSIIGVNAFDQPGVQDSKKRTVAKIEAYQKAGHLDEGKLAWESDGIQIYGKDLPKTSGSLESVLLAFINQGKPGDYVAINAYLSRNARSEADLRKLRVAIRQRTHLATTVGFGPRFLHSTGQLHKGGPNTGLFLEITANEPDDIRIPQEGITFGILERAQALGDLEALQARDRRAIRIHLQNPDLLRKVLEAAEH